MSGVEILDNGTKAIMENGDKIPFDIALLSIGITANTDIVSNTNIETKKGKIVISRKDGSTYAYWVDVEKRIVTREETIR